MESMLKKNILIFSVFTLLSGFMIKAGAEESEYGWLKSSTEKENIIILESFKGMGLAEKIISIKYLSEREDKNYAFLINDIYHSGSLKSGEREYLLFLILDILVVSREAAAKTGRPFIDICRDISSYRQSNLRKKIMEKTSLMEKNDSEGVLMKEALFLRDFVKHENTMNQEMLEECRIFFRKAYESGSAVLADYTEMIYTEARNIPESFRKP